jgi:hypothetical protein
MLSLRKGGGIVFKKLFSVFAVLALFVAAAPVEAASIEFDLSGYVTSDVFTSPVVFTPGSYFYPATLPTDATGKLSTDCYQTHNRSHFPYKSLKIIVFIRVDVRQTYLYAQRF